MASQQQTRGMIGVIAAKTHRDLPKVTAEELQDVAVQRQVLSDGDQGIQTAVVGPDGSIKTVIGLNGVRNLPDPYPDPLDEILQQVLDAAGKDTK